MAKQQGQNQTTKENTTELSRETQTLDKRLGSKAVLQFQQLFLRLSGPIISVCPLGFTSKWELGEKEK